MKTETYVLEVTVAPATIIEVPLVVKPVVYEIPITKELLTILAP